MIKNTKKSFIFLVLILIGVFLMGSVSAYGDCGKVYQVGHSYRNTERTYTQYVGYGMDRVTNPPRISYDYNYNRDYSYVPRHISTVRYTQHAIQKTREDFVGSYVKDYIVTVSNKERTGRYYTVQFNFVDKNGYRFTQSMTQYLRDGERKKFDYKDIQFERHEITDWDYNIIEEDY
jgi:hypothetical protein